MRRTFHPWRGLIGGVQCAAAVVACQGWCQGANRPLTDTPNVRVDDSWLGTWVMQNPVSGESDDVKLVVERHGAFEMFVRFEPDMGVKLRVFLSVHDDVAMLNLEMGGEWLFARVVDVDDTSVVLESPGELPRRDFDSADELAEAVLKSFSGEQSRRMLERIRRVDPADGPVRPVGLPAPLMPTQMLVAVFEQDGPEAALAELKRMIDGGFDGFTSLRDTDDLAPLRALPGFDSLLNQSRENWLRNVGLEWRLPPDRADGSTRPLLIVLSPDAKGPQSWWVETLRRRAPESVILTRGTGSRVVDKTAAIGHFIDHAAANWSASEDEVILIGDRGDADNALRFALQHSERLAGLLLIDLQPLKDEHPMALREPGGTLPIYIVQPLEGRAMPEYAKRHIPEWREQGFPVQYVEVHESVRDSISNLHEREIARALAWLRSQSKSSPN